MPPTGGTGEKHWNLSALGCSLSAPLGFYTPHKPQIFGRYLLLDRIGVGGMAEVYRGKIAGVEGFERIVALKRILPTIAEDPDFIEMFVEEAKLAVQLQHANIAQVHDLGKVDDSYYIAMEYVAGVGLRKLWDRARGRSRLLPIAMSAFILQKVCEGLDAAHRKTNSEAKALGLVHRDVSPQNILISFEGEVKIIDFGIAKAATRISKTRAGVLKGKFGYMSPEQVRGTELDNRSDIFACGVVLYELLVGERLFIGNSDFATLEKVRKAEFEPPSSRNKTLAPELERIVLKALEKDRKKRYRWGSEMAEDLARYLYATDQPFGRTDLQRYMHKHFQEDMDQEKERIRGYAALDIENIVGDEKAASAPPPPTEDNTEAPKDPSPAELARSPTVLGTERVSTRERPNPAPEIEVVPAARQKPAPLPRPNGPEERRLPTWAAIVMGGLIAALLIAGAALAYVLANQQTPASLTIEVTPPKAKIFVNDDLVSNQSPFTLDHLQPATYLVRVEAKAHEELIRAVRLAPGEARIENFMLEKTPAPN